jgi:hypothetical protein
MLWSTQWKIVNDISISFQTNEITNVKISKNIERDKLFLNYNKYSHHTKENFKFIVLWTCLTYNTSTTGTLKKLNTYTKENLMYINQQKDKMTYYCNTLKEDTETMKPCILNFANVKYLYNTGQISIVGLWSFLKSYSPETRLEKKFYNNVKLFMSYFKEQKC